MQDRPGPWRLLRKTVNEGDILQVGPRNEIVRENRRAIENHGSDVREDLNGIRDELRAFDERLRNVVIAFGKVDQRLLTLECVLLDWLGGAGQDE